MYWVMLLMANMIFIIKVFTNIMIYRVLLVLTDMISSRSLLPPVDKMINIKKIYVCLAANMNIYWHLEYEYLLND